MENREFWILFLNIDFPLLGSYCSRSIFSPFSVKKKKRRGFCFVFPANGYPIRFFFTAPTSKWYSIGCRLRHQRLIGRLPSILVLFTVFSLYRYTSCTQTKKARDMTSSAIFGVAPFFFFSRSLKHVWCIASHVIALAPLIRTKFKNVKLVITSTARWRSFYLEARTKTNS